MKKFYSLLLATVAFSILSYSQTLRCGQADYEQYQQSIDPNYDLTQQQIRQQIDSIVAQNKKSFKPFSLYTIPVVFHVVYNTAAQNLSDATILAILDMLNKDFSRQNTDAANTPSVFQPVAANMEIQFCLATVDPNGNATNGITRTSTSVTSFTTDDKVKYTAQGGHDVWNSSKYMNVWVCNLGSGLVGYATFPGGPAATRGVVMCYKYIGPNGQTPFHLNRQMTHEVGHFFNLRHIWGDANCGNDFCNDTPTQQAANYGMPTFPKISCSNGPNGDMFMNYMDYTDDAAMNLFTNDQKTRAQALMTTTYASLASSNGCGSPGLDASISSIVVPGGYSCDLGFIPKVSLTNYSAATLTTCTVNFRVDNSTNQTYNWAGSLGNGQSTYIFLPSMSSATGTHTFTCFSSNPNGGTDPNINNDQATSTFTISALAVNINSSNASCNTASNGSCIASISAGSPPYTYAWSNGSSTQGITGLTAGVYSVTITDSSGCTAVSADTITAISSLAVTINSNNTSCNTAGNGSCTAVVSGGSPSYTYTWSNGGSTQTITGLTAGVYSVTITDSLGCTVVSGDTITANTPNYNVLFSANPQAGTAPLIVAFANATPNPSNYNFNWFFGDGSNIVSNTTSTFHTYQFNGLYDVALIATSIANGCTDTLLQPGFILTTGGTACTHSATITPPGPISKCLGDTAFLSCNTDTAFTYQWNYNSIAITGATTSTLAATQSGYYSLTIFQNNCPVTSAAVQVNFKNSPPTPTINQSGTIAPCVGGSVTLTSSAISGGTYQWSSGQTTQSIVVTIPGTYSVTVSNAVGCSSTGSDTVTTTLTTQAVCMATVDSSFAKNVVIWSKPIVLNIDSFKIYREVASTFKHIGSVAYSALSKFTDNTVGVNPNITSYKYKISMLDTCGSESALSPFHRTIHLSISPATPCGYNLLWNDYVGFSVTQYRILRDSAGMGWKAIDSVSFGNNSWTDINCYPPQDTIRYVLEVDHTTNCTASLKGETPMSENYITSRSNSQSTISPATSVIKNDNVHVKISVHPNPASGIFIIKSNSKISSFVIMNTLGEKVYSINKAHVDQFTLDICSVPSGIYFLQIQTGNGTVTKKIVKE